MYKKNEPPIVNHPYTTAGGHWRIFDGKHWRDCDKNGRIKNNGVDD